MMQELRGNFSGNRSYKRGVLTLAETETIHIVGLFLGLCERTVSPSDSDQAF